MKNIAIFLSMITMISLSSLYASDQKPEPATLAVVVPALPEKSDAEQSKDNVQNNAQWFARVRGNRKKYFEDATLIMEHKDAQGKTVTRIIMPGDPEMESFIDESGKFCVRYVPKKDPSLGYYQGSALLLGGGILGGLLGILLGYKITQWTSRRGGE